MPTPPKESIGGFINQVMESELKQIEINFNLISTFMQNEEEFGSYDEDFKTYVSERAKLLDETRAKILGLQDIIIKS